MKFSEILEKIRILKGDLKEIIRTEIYADSYKKEWEKEMIKIRLLEQSEKSLKI